jgi:hypothetical protein
MSEARNQAPEDADQVALRLLTAQFFISCEKLPPCWYRVNSRENNMLPDSESKALLPSLADIFGMPDKRANDLLLACGLMKWRAKKLNMNIDSWNELKSEYGIDIEVETVSHAKFIGSRILLVRVGSFKEESPFTAKDLVKQIDATKAYFGLRLTAHENEVKGLGEGYYKPITEHYFDANQKKHEYWYKPVDELLAHEVDDMLTVQLVPTVLSVDAVVGADHGQGEFRMILMILFRCEGGKTIKYRFTVGELPCKKDTALVMKQSFMVKQNEALHRLNKEKKVILTSVPDEDGNLRISAVFSDADLQKEGAGTKLKEIPLRLFACGDLAFYHLILGREHMSHHWCWLCMLSPKEWKEGLVPTPEQLWNIARMKAKHDEALRGADRKGMQEYPIWDAIEPDHFLAPILHKQIGLVDNILTALWAFTDEFIECLTDDEMKLRNDRLLMEVANDGIREAVDEWNEREGMLLELAHNERDVILEKELDQAHLTPKEDEELEALDSDIQLMEDDIANLRESLAATDSNLTLATKAEKKARG